MAASHWSVYLWRAREACGAEGTRRSSFFTSSNGSNTTFKTGRLLASFEAKTTPPRPAAFLFGYGTVTADFNSFEFFNEENEREKPTFSLCKFEKEQDLFRSIFQIERVEREMEMKRGRWQIEL